MIRLNNWITLSRPLKAEDDEGASSTTAPRSEKIESETETQPSSLYETPRSFEEGNCQADSPMTKRNKMIPWRLTSPVTNSCDACSCTTYPKLKRSSRHHVELTTKEKEGLLSVSVSPLSSLDNSLDSRCGSVATDPNTKKSSKIKHPKDFLFTRQRNSSILDHLGKNHKSLKRSMKAWKRERKEMNSSSVMRSFWAINGNDKGFLTQRREQLLDSRPLLLLMKKVKERQHRRLTASGIRTMPQSSTGKENIPFMDEFGNFVDNLGRTSPEDEALIASIVKVGVGDPVLTGGRQKKTKMISSSKFECCALVTPNNSVEKKVSFLKKSGNGNSNSDPNSHLTEDDKNIYSRALASGVGVGHLYAEQQRRIHQLNMQVLEKEKLIDLLQQQLSEAKQEIENSIDFYAMSVIKLEGNIMAMSEEHELEVTRLKEEISALSSKRSPEIITRQNKSQPQIVHHYIRTQNRPSSAPNDCSRSHYHS